MDRIPICFYDMYEYEDINNTNPRAIVLYPQVVERFDDEYPSKVAFSAYQLEKLFNFFGVMRAGFRKGCIFTHLISDEEVYKMYTDRCIGRDVKVGR